MWIRSQDKEDLVDTKRIIVIGKKITSDVTDDYLLFGEYESKERAIEVLDEIEKFRENHPQYTYNMPLQ